MSAPELERGELDKSVDRFYERLREVGAYLLTKSSSEVSELEMRELTNELDGMWPFQNELCYVSGDGLIPLYDDEGAQRDEMYGHLNGVIVQSRGVILRRLPGNDCVQPYHCFLQREQLEWTLMTKQSTHLSHIFLEANANVMPVRLIEDAYDDSGEQTVEIANTFEDELSAYSSWFMTKLKSRSFRRWPQTKQAEFVDNYISFCNDRFRLRKTPLQFAGQYCLRPLLAQGDSGESTQSEAAEDTVSYEFVPLNRKSAVGMIMGFGTPVRSVVQERPIRVDADMYDPTAGLCLNIEVNQPEPDSLLRAGEVVLVPLSGQDLDLTFE